MVDLVFDAPTNVTTFVQKIAYLDGLTDVGFGGILGVVFLLIIFGVLILMMKSFRFESVIAPASFITAFLGILIRILFPISDQIIYISIIILIIGLLYLKNNDAQQEI